ncbi:hypothetical protein M422DRAFT_49793 [Sphaerobolus stellatus SS14]|uniref:F-box domain-containing protein n=1 Tax=Sphaerobolus stellatus (strain SS14) TaxID=990650 RepID=A0A0C9U7E2_SPHS4|nr:hypothetical protein M422DRAFT_49793 [Sphaerobolus stellatus SS14]
MEIDSGFADIGLTERSHENTMQARSISSLHMNTLPPEILGEIFKYCLEPFTPDVLNDIRRSSYTSNIPIITSEAAPLQLMCICKYWRNAALQTPALFTRIFLYGGHLSVDPTIIVPMWLKHSKALPIDIVIEPERWSIRATSKEVKNIFHEISRNVHRIRSFRCTVGGFLDGLFPSGMALLAESLENLAFLTARRHPTVLIRGRVHIGTVIAPRLRSFETDFGSRSLYFVSPAGHHLRVYINQGVDQSLSELAAILQASPNVEICRLESAISTTRDRLDWDGLILSLPYLRELTISSIKRYDDLCPFLDSLRFQGLETLKVSWDQICTAEEFGHSLQSMFPVPRGSSLRRLHVCGFPSLDTSISRMLLLRFALLDELFIESCGLIQEIIKTLQSWTFCPELAYIHLFVTDVPGDELVAMLRRRTGAEGEIPEYASPLQKIVIRFCRGLSTFNFEQLQHLRDEHVAIMWTIWNN